MKRSIAVIISTLLLLSARGSIVDEEFPIYRVVIDPGHGGVGIAPKDIHGDRYDALSGTYLDYFRAGASYRGIDEHLMMYSIAEKANKILADAAPGGDFAKFRELLSKYTDTEPRRIHIKTMMSRGPSLTDQEVNSLEDPNAEYRMFDFPGSDGKMRKGRISKINDFRPHLVVSLHNATWGPREYDGMNPVLVPSFDMLNYGLSYLKKETKDREYFNTHPMRYWFMESSRRSRFSWFLNDTSLYFTGYPLRSNGTLDTRDFRGYRYNMISWRYADKRGWEEEAQKHPENTRYGKGADNFSAEGKFWNRERSVYERYRRAGGPEGFGGDNAYASYELIRYMLLALKKHGYDHPSQQPGKSYVNVWIMPLHVNAINAFIEIGYFARERDRYLLTKRHQELAEGIAVGVYSLLTGIETNEKAFRHAPKGEPLDLDKYQITEDLSYFEQVVTPDE